jgi:flagellar biosynthesis/type III secretory pathway protein FliH
LIAPTEVLCSGQSLGYHQGRCHDRNVSLILADSPEFFCWAYKGRSLFNYKVERAIREVLALPASNPRRDKVLRLIASWKVRLDLGELADFIDQEEIMAFSEAFLTWEQETKDRGLQEGLQAGLQAGRQEGLQAGKQEERVEIAKNLLRQGLQAEAITQATGLTVAQLQDLQGQLG